MQVLGWLLSLNISYFSIFRLPFSVKDINAQVFGFACHYGMVMISNAALYCINTEYLLLRVSDYFGVK